METKGALVWLAMWAISLGATWSGLRFRSGRSLRMLPLLNRSDLPAAYRNLPLAAPLLGPGLIVASVLATPLMLRLDLGVILPSNLVGALWLFAGGICFLAVGAFAIVLCRPRPWMVPVWLRAEFPREPMPLSWFDRITLLWGAVNIGLGCALLAGAVLFAAFGT